MAERMTITVDAGQGSNDARAFVQVMDDVLDALDALAKVQGVSPDWTIESLSKHSPPKAVISTASILGLMLLLVDGVGRLESRPDRPFADPVVRVVKRMGERIGKTVDHVTLSVDGAEGKSQRAVTPTPNLAKNAAAVLSRRHYSVPASVDGRLDILNVHSKRFRFSIFDEIDGNEVRCKFDDGLFDRVKENIGKRVTAVGVVKYADSDDRPVSIKVESIEPLDIDQDPPTLFSAMPSIDVAGGMASEEYVRRLRDGR